MAKPVVAKKKYTYQDYLKTPDGERYELIQGDLVRLTSPNTTHQRISGELLFRLVGFSEKNDVGEFFHAPCDVYFDEENVLQPDILFISKARTSIIGEANIQGAPDLVVEIASESTAYRDAIQKKMLYARFGVKEFWVVAPKEKFIEVYSLKNKEYALVKTYFYEDTLESLILKGFRVALKGIF